MPKPHASPVIKPTPCTCSPPSATSYDWAGAKAAPNAAAAAAIEYAGIEHAATLPLFPASPGLAGAGGAAATVPQPLPHLHAPQPPRAAE